MGFIGNNFGERDPMMDAENFAPHKGGPPKKTARKKTRPQKKAAGLTVVNQTWGLLPPPKDKCQQCAGDHAPEWPHNQQSMFWQYWFLGKHGRWPKWKDALEHCAPTMRARWVEELGKRGIEVDQ
jgi:hypothetical protein